MKRKILIPILAVMLCIGMIGVGFAAWVIATTNSVEVTDNDMFIAYDVKNQTVMFTSSFADGEVIFGSKTFDTSEGATNHGWLTLEEGENNEDLNAELQIVITNWETNSLADETITFQLSAFTILSGDNNVTDTYKDKYINLPTVGKITITKGELDETSVKAGITFSDGTLSVPLTFGWGSKFGGVNPNQYYNSQASNTSLVAQAETDLGVLSGLHQLKFRVTVAADLIVTPAGN